MPLYKFSCALLLLIILLSTSGPALSLTKDDPLEALTTRLQQQHFLQGSYTQKRTLKGFSRPLTSSGEFKFWQSHGLYWQTNKPFFHAMTYSHKETLYWSETGELISGQAPNVTERHINKILLAIFSADIKELKKLFDLKIDQADNNTWNIELTPNNLIVSQALLKVTLMGSNYLEKASIFSTNGNKNTILFTDTQHAEIPSPEQCQRFFNATPKDCR